MYEKLQRRYDDLAGDVYVCLTQEVVERPDEPREDYDYKVKKVNVFGYTHIALIEGDLYFLDESGYQYSLYADCNLQDLIEILTNW